MPDLAFFADQSVGFGRTGLFCFMLVAEGFRPHIPKGYIYGALAFSEFVEIFNIRLPKSGTDVSLHESYTKGEF